MTSKARAGETAAGSTTVSRAPRPNLAAVAALAGVSPSTASLAFSGAGPVSEATRDRVLAAAEQLNYPGPDPRAQSLRRGRSGIIGVVLEQRLGNAFVDPITIAMLDGIADEAGTIGAGLLLLTESSNGIANLSSAPMDAVILFGCSTRLDHSVAVFRRRGMPIVAIEAPPIDDVLAIGLDDRAASVTGAQHLRDLGHRRISVVALPMGAAQELRPLPATGSPATSYTSLERLRGVRDVYPQVSGYVATWSSIDAGRDAGLALLADETSRPTAVVAQSDLLAVGVIRAAEELGLSIPRDLSVIGFDGVRVAGSERHDLTTLVQPAVEMGQAAGRAVIDLLAGKQPEPVSFTCLFRLGNTTAPPKR